MPCSRGPFLASLFASLLLLVFGRTARAQPAPPTPPPPGPPQGGTADAAPETDDDDGAPREVDFVPRLSGYLQVFFRFNVDSNGDGAHRPSAFRVQRARLKVEGDLTTRISYDVEIDPRAPQVTGILRDCFLAVRLLEHQTLRIGQQKTQFGWENRQSSTELWAVNRTELSDSLGRGVTLRDIGLGLVGRQRLGGGFRLENGLTVVNGAGMNAQEDDDGRKNFFGRLGGRYKFGGNKVWLGVSGALGSMFESGDLDLDPADDFTLAFRRVGTDIEFDTAGSSSRPSSRPGAKRSSGRGPRVHPSARRARSPATTRSSW